MPSRSSSVTGSDGRCARRKMTASAASACRTSDGTQTKRLVEAAQTVPAQVNRHMRVPERPQLTVDRSGGFRLHGAGDLILPQLESRDRVVMADTADPETHIPQHRLGGFDRSELLSVTSLKYGM